MGVYLGDTCFVRLARENVLSFNVVGVAVLPSPLIDNLRTFSTADVEQKPIRKMLEIDVRPTECSYGTIFFRSLLFCFLWRLAAVSVGV